MVTKITSKKALKAYDNDRLREVIKDKENIFAAVEKEIECGVVVLDDKQLEKWNRVKQLTPLQQDVLFTYAQYKTKAAEIYGVSITYIYTLMKEIMVIVNGYSI
jgi:hypothetical protein